MSTLDMGPFAGMVPALEEAITQYGTPPERQAITVYVRDLGNYEFDNFPDTPKGMIDWIIAACDDAPMEYRDHLKFYLEYEQGSYGDGDSAALKIWYERPENDDEMRERVGRGINYVREREEHERNEYERLKVRFEQP